MFTNAKVVKVCFTRFFLTQTTSFIFILSLAVNTDLSNITWGNSSDFTLFPHEPQKPM